MSSWIVRGLLLAAVNLLAGKLALLLAIPPGYATALWPPSGIALGAVLLWGYRMLPGVLMGSILINVDIDGDNAAVSVLVAISIGLASTLQAAAGAFLIRRFVGFPNPLVRQRDVRAFFALGGPIACLIAATIAVLSLCAAGFISTSNVPFSWWTWWVGDSIGVLIFSPLMLIFFGTPREVWARRKPTVALPLVVAVVGVTFLFVYASNREHQRQQLEFNERCTRLADELTDQLHGYQEVMWSVGRFFDSSEEVTRDEFRRFTEPTMRRLRGMQGLGWNPKVPFQALALFEARVREEGFPSFRVTQRNASGQLIPVRPRDQYFPALYIVPFDGNLESLGYDVASEPVRAEAMERALVRNKAAMTGPVKLVQDKEGRWGVLLFVPVFQPHATLDSEADRRRHLHGYAVGAFRIDDMVDEALSVVPSDAPRLTFRLVDATAPDSEQDLYTGQWRVLRNDAPSRFTREMTHVVSGRKWILRFIGTQEYIAKLVSWQAWIVDAIGLAFTALLGLFLLILDGRAVELESTNAKLHEAVKARDEFLSIASHELRTPLTPLKLQLQSALRRLEKETTSTSAQDRFMKNLHVIDDQVDRLTRLVDDLLDTSRITVGRLVLEKQSVDVRQLVIEVLERHRNELRAAASRATLHAPKPVVGVLDRWRMEQVITNLLTNAIKYAPEKPVHISLTSTHDRMTLTVRDEGPGIAEKDLVRIFERFERAAIPGQQRGLGLGLFIVRQIVEAHGGTVRAASEPGRGATFIVEMPLSVEMPNQ